MPNLTYILAPSFHFKPGTGPIALGNIVTDPLRPHRALTTVDANLLRETYPRVETYTSRDRSMTHEAHHDLAMSVWGQFLNTISAKVSGGSGANLHSEYTMDTLETVYFVGDPPHEEIEARVRSPRVKAVMKRGRRLKRKPIYMVTGIMVAKGFAAVQERGTHRTGEAGVEAGDVSMGATVSRSSGAESSDRWTSNEDIVFAYQLLKIEVKGFKGARIEYDELRHKAGYLSTIEDEEQDGEDEDSIEIAATQLGPDDLSEANATSAEGGLKVTCLWTKDEE